MAGGKVCPVPACPGSREQLSEGKEEHKILFNWSFMTPAASVIHQTNITVLLLVKYFFFWARQPPVCKGFLIVEASQSHPDTPHSVGLLWTSDQLVAETST